MRRQEAWQPPPGPSADQSAVGSGRGRGQQVGEGFGGAGPAECANPFLVAVTAFLTKAAFEGCDCSFSAEDVERKTLVCR